LSENGAVNNTLTNIDVLQFLAEQRSYAWLLAGLLFLGLGMVVGEPVVASLGIAAVITAIAAITVHNLVIELILWGVLSVCLIIVLRGLVPKENRDLSPDSEATVSEIIPKSGIGIVTYEGSLYKARCQISDIAIMPGEVVQVVARQGLTLIVMPTNFSDEPLDSR
jgi:membrane protein implicated in regulation of membrane protease activity